MTVAVVLVAAAVLANVWSLPAALLLCLALLPWVVQLERGKR